MDTIFEFSNLPGHQSIRSLFVVIFNCRWLFNFPNVKQVFRVYLSCLRGDKRPDPLLQFQWESGIVIPQGHFPWTLILECFCCTCPPLTWNAPFIFCKNGFSALQIQDCFSHHCVCSETHPPHFLTKASVLLQPLLATTVNVNKIAAIIPVHKHWLMNLTLASVCFEITNKVVWVRKSKKNNCPIWLIAWRCFR